MHIKQILLITGLLIGMLSGKTYASIEPYQNQKQGTIKKGDTLIVKDEKFLNSAYDWSRIHNKTVTDIVTFGLYRDSMSIPQKKFKCTINLKVEYWSSPDQVDPVVDDHVKLEIDYDTVKGISYQANATYRFKNGYKVKLTVNDITSDELGDQLPGIFRLTGQVIVERSYEVDSAHIVPRVILPTSGKTGTFNAAMMRSAISTGTQAGVASISWDSQVSNGADFYDLEWTFIDELSDDGKILSQQGTATPVSELARMFKNNATRVTVSHEYYDIPLVHYKKFLLVRERFAYIDGFGFRREMDWDYSMDDGGNTVNAVIALDDAIVHEPNLNWQYTATYSEEGKRKEVVSYFDGSMRDRQSVTLSNTDQKVLIQEKLYDEFGRPMVSILPYAKNSNVLKYYTGQHLNAANNGNYTWANVYGNSTDCINTPQAMGTGAGAGQYYSSGNEFMSDNSHPETPYIPDAAGYPFSVTLYTPDNTNRVSVQGGVGALFQPGPDNTVSKATRLYYAKPQQWELDRMFGNDVGYANHYLKNMTMDGNGQLSVSYLNAAGKTIATALAGDAPANQDALASKTSPKQETFYVLEPRNFTFDESKLTLSASSSYTPTSTGPVSFTYNVQKLIQTYEENGVKICSNCYYDLHIKITDDCKRVINDMTTPVGSLTSDCTATGNAAATISTSFDKIGEYYIYYELALSSTAMDNFTTNFITKNTNLNSKWSYINQELQAKDMTTCFDDCTTCLTSLGTQTAFVTAVKNRLSKDGVELTSTIDTWANNLYTSLYNNCVSLQTNCTSNPCADLENTMKQDVSPGGQYALFDANDNALEQDLNVVYLHWREAFPVLNRNDATYIANQFTLEDGTVMSVNDEQLTLADLVHNWRPEWAEPFVKWHPEYCALKFCRDNSANLQWEERLSNVAKIADLSAVVPGATYNTANASWLADYDPAFNNVLLNYKTNFVSDLNNYSKNVMGITQVGTKNLFGYVDYLLYCADNSGSTNANNHPLPGTDNWTTCAPVASCRIPDLEWQTYRAKYIELKDKYYAMARGTDAYCGSVCQIGEPLGYATSPVTCPPLSSFTVQTNDATCSNGGLQSLKLTYTGAPLTAPVTVSLKYPAEYNGLTTITSVPFAAGQTEAAFCISSEIRTASILVSGISCNGGSTGGGSSFSCGAAAAASNFRMEVVRDGLTYNPSTGYANYNCTIYYSGPDLPSGASITCTVEFGFNPAPNATFRQYVFTGSTKSITKVLEGVKDVTYDMGIPACYNPNPGTTTPPVDNSPCSAYKYKVSRINSTSYSTAGISTDTIALKAQGAAALTQSINENCEAQAEMWMKQLDECLSGQADYQTAKTNIKAKLIELCKIGGDATHPLGASTTPGGKSASGGYTSFKQVLTGMLTPHTLSMVCNPWLLDAPYPYNVTIQTSSKLISKTDATVCAKLATLKAAYTSAGGGSSFYQYLVNTYGSAMNLTEAELTSLQNGCDNCRYLLANSLTLPVFLDGTATGSITSATFQSGLAQMNSEIGSWLDAQHPNYEHVYASYLNQLWGFTLSYSDYQDYVTKLTTNPNAVLCNTPVYGTVTVNPYRCTEEMIDDAVSTGTVLYNEYIAEEKKKFRRNYIAYCGGAQPNLQMTTFEQLYHYTLYYYDQAGNLVRTVPPEGVHLLDASLQPQIDGARNRKGESCTFDGPIKNTLKDSTLMALRDAFNATSPRAMELWMYNASATGGQFLATSSDQKYLVNACVSGRYLHLDVYTLATTTNEVAINASVHTIADMQSALPLTPWTHVVFQGAILNANNLSVYVNGKLCPVTTTNQPSGDCGWTLENGNYPENLASLKQIRFYNRTLSAPEIAANAAESCMSLASDYYAALSGALIYRGRFNTATLGAGTTSGAGSYTETQYSPVYPVHGLATSYAYQSLDKVSVQASPDGGKSKFWYDRLGRITASQNAQQNVEAKYSYTRYDDQSRIIEVGEKTSGVAPVSRFMQPAEVTAFHASGSNGQIVNTYYDTYSGFAYTQENLRKRVAATTYKDLASGEVQQATYYSYDQLGNVKTLWQQLKDLGIKQVDYQYDLAINKANKLRYNYQGNSNDRFWYGYQYDADNRIRSATTGVSTVSDDGWDIENEQTDASYNYYLHGPLARTELGHGQLVQGIDYAYTIQGWVKLVNGQYLSPTSDIGGDGGTGGRSAVAPDVYGYSLDYFKGDYKPISTTAAALLPLSWADGATSEVGRNLYNGNISRSTMAISQFNNVVGYSYRYDQLNRLRKMRTHGLTTGATTWSAATAGDAYQEDVTYDGNGNILTYLRNGSGVNKGKAMDNLSYGYQRDAAGNLLTNRLLQVKDAVTSTEYADDLRSQNDGNYSYDNIGNLVKDDQAGISKIEWTAYGKIRSITNTKNNTYLDYRYDATGNRIYKGYTHGGVTDKTWYVRDAQGNVLAVYGNKNGDNQIYWKEQNLYGSQRLGVWTPDMVVTSNNAVSLWGMAGKKKYELSNHLGNVIATVGDYLGGDNKAVATSAQDYYPFGMMQPDRRYSSDGYRYGFNGKENDNEVNGEGNLISFEFREYDPRIGRFMSIDPQSGAYPWQSPFVYHRNNPVNFTDYKGLGDPPTLDWVHFAERHLLGGNMSKSAPANMPNSVIINPAWQNRTAIEGFFQEAMALGKASGKTMSDVTLSNGTTWNINTKDGHFYPVNGEGIINLTKMETAALRSAKAGGAASGEQIFANLAKNKSLGKVFSKEMVSALESLAKIENVSVGKALSHIGMNIPTQLNGISGEAIQKALVQFGNQNPRFVHWGGRAMLLVSAASDIIEVYNSDDKVYTVTKKVFSWTVAGEFAAGSALAASETGPGALLVGFVGGAVGYFVGEQFVESVHQVFFTKAK
ncbi:RHS repeat-associated core domain-containing protein [Chitinophaga sp.]|uniref:RHS repeat-associated core domain-containing protein n=1 Tax=Chitinophaga sp. TaxID=1869181 RepID=UPI0031DFC722